MEISFIVFAAVLIIICSLAIISHEIVVTIHPGNYLLNKKTQWRILHVTEFMITIQSGTIVKKIHPLMLLFTYKYFPL